MYYLQYRYFLSILDITSFQVYTVSGLLSAVPASGLGHFDLHPSITGLPLFAAYGAGAAGEKPEIPVISRY